MSEGGLSRSLRAQLEEGLVALKLPLSEAQAEQLLRFLALIHKWNRVHNLTAIKSQEEMVARHLLDSLSLLPYVCGRSVLDVGSGAGLPGLPLAIAAPDFSFVLLDSALKRVTFMRQVVAELTLANVVVLHARVEDYRPAVLPACIVSRAFASVADYLAGVDHLRKPEGCVLALKGPQLRQEATAEPYTLIELLPLPGLDARFLARWPKTK